MNTHAACLSVSLLCHLPSHRLSLSPRHAQAAISLWFTNTSRFHFSPPSLCVRLSLSLDSPKWNIDIWVEGHTAHSALPHCTHDPLSVRSVIRHSWQNVPVYAWERFFFLCSSISVVQHLQTLSVLVDWDKSVRNRIDCGVYWNATNEVGSSNI